MNIGSNLPPGDPPPVWFVGEHKSKRNGLAGVDLVPEMQELGYDFVTTNITTEAYQERISSIASKAVTTSQDNKNAPLPSIPPLTPADTCIAPDDANIALVAITNPHIDLGSSNPVIRHISRQVFHAELAYAAFCGVNHVVISGPVPDSDVVQYARAVFEGLGAGPYLSLAILLPFSGELEHEQGNGTHLSELAQEVADLKASYEDDDSNEPFKVWDQWHTIRSICNYSNKVTIALEIPGQAPSPSLQSRWLSEPVRMLVFQRTSFVRNAKGYPVLPKQHQQLVSRFARFRFPPSMLCSDLYPMPITNPNGLGHTFEPTPAQAAAIVKERPPDPIPHLRYLRHLQNSQPPRPPMERFGQGYQDYLQSPLQPLTDNLESITYEVFEKDPVKYEWYEKAIVLALKDLRFKVEQSRNITVAVVGAGRGPLVTRALKAAQTTGIAIDCWAVEKNPNAFVLLQHHNATDSLWGGQVKVVKSDMRYWQGPTIEGETRKVDIFVSELLGSFADNELSPECLDGVQHLLHPEHGVSIPQSYSAHLTPISTPRLYGDLLGRPGDDQRWELPWVVMLHMFDYLCTEGDSKSAQKAQVKEAWSFSHPLPKGILEQSKLRAGGSTGAQGWTGGDGKNEHNARTCTVSFKSKNPGVCHGVAGYFETVLYASDGGKVELSTNPVTMAAKSKDMISWFPIFFPLRTPIYIPEDSEIIVSMWRQTDDRSVWYEWMVEVMQEVNGKKRKVAISEGHSSRKNACLM